MTSCRNIYKMKLMLSVVALRPKLHSIC